MTDNKKVLIITYYWPPSGGAGVQRWLKFTKYLPDFGWDPIVFTPENPQFDLKDDSLIEEINPKVDVLKFPIWEPYRLFKRLTGTKEIKQGQILEEENNSFLKSISVFLRGNLFVPDPRRFWIKPSVEYLDELIRSNQIKHIISTGPPHSLHLIALTLKIQNPSLTWMADFRDPWTEWDIMKRFKMLPIIKRKHAKMEREVLKVADVTLATGNQAAEDLKVLGARRTAVFTNGYDKEMSDVGDRADTSLAPSILHLGMLNENRSPDLFFKSLNKTLIDFPKALTLKFTGIISPKVRTVIENLAALSEVVQVESSVPYIDLMKVYQTADVLLLLQSDSQESNSQLPGKLFEYLAQRKPILAFGDPNSDVANILKSTNSGRMLSYQDRIGIDKVVDELKNGTFGQDFKYLGIEKYSRKAITKELAKLLDEFN